MVTKIWEMEVPGPRLRRRISLRQRGQVKPAESPPLETIRSMSGSADMRRSVRRRLEVSAARVLSERRVF